MRAGNVVRYSYDDATRTLTGTVDGNAATPYTTQVRFLEDKTSHYAFTATCTCPVRTDCKHAVALMLSAIDQSTKAKRALTASSKTWKPGETKARLDADELRKFGVFAASQLQDGDAAEPEDSKIPAWRRTLSHTLAARPSRYVPKPSQLVSGALDLKFTVPSAFGFGAPRSKVPHVLLQARPLMAGARNNWIKGGMTWEDFQRDLAKNAAGHNIYPEHHQWFSEFYSIVRPWQSAYSSHRDWVSLGSLSSSLLWEVLWRAREISLPLLLEGNPIQFDIADASSVTLQATQADDSLRLSPVLAWDGYEFDASACHPLGDPRIGFIALGGVAQAAYETAARDAKWEKTRSSALATATEIDEEHELEELPADLLFIPLEDTLSPAADQLTASGAVTIPSTDTQDFYKEFYPQLVRSVPIFTRDENLVLPSLKKPKLVLTVEFSGDSSQTALTSWRWDYPKFLTDTPENTNDEIVVLPAIGYPTEDSDLRDIALEHEVYKRVRTLAPSLPFAKHRVTEWATRELVSKTLPALRKLENVVVEVIGDEPVFHELDDAVITVSVEETGRRDWFGLGIAIKAGEWYVPFSKIFEALNADKTHMLLGDGSYFALDKPEFRKLADLIREAQAIDDKSGPLQISRHQAGLWEELEELAADVKAVDSWDTHVSALLNLDNEEPPAVPASLQAELRPYQLEGFQWLTFCWEHELGGILADDMGLGKTVQTIALMAYAKEKALAAGKTFAPFLVVAPTSVVPNWVREVEKFAPSLKVKGVHETQNKSGVSLAEYAAGADVVVTSYAIFRLDQDAYMEVAPGIAWNGLILDEAQFVKNAKTKAHKVARDVDARFKLAVTGTPMENNLMELWSMFSITAPGLFPSARNFKEYFARPIESAEDTSETLQKLRSRIRPLMKRRTKELVATDLPEKNEQRVDVPLAPAHRKAYDTHLQRERQKILGLLRDMDKNRFTIFQSLTTLRRLALDASLIDEKYASVESSKLDYLEENLPEIIGEGHRALIFSQFTGYLKKIAERLDKLGIKYLYLDGTTRNRAAVLDAFEDGEAPVFLISLKAGGVGLNLTSADYCFIMDPWWNPAAEQQAVDRVHRIGQTKNVMVYRLVSAGTIEEKVMELKESKAELFDAVVDEGQFFSGQLTAEQVKELLTSD